jgi:hypothetical protein
MKVNEDFFCDSKGCHERIEPGEMETVRKPGRDGKQDDDFEHFHRRWKRDCYWEYLRDKVIEAQRVSRQEPIQAT